MDFKRLGTFLIIGGAAVIAAAFAWWMTFYSSILQELGGASVAQRNECSFCALFYSSKTLRGYDGFARLSARRVEHIFFGRGGRLMRVFDPFRRQATRRLRVCGKRECQATHIDATHRGEDGITIRGCERPAWRSPFLIHEPVNHGTALAHRGGSMRNPLPRRHGVHTSADKMARQVIRPTRDGEASTRSVMEFMLSIIR